MKLILFDIDGTLLKTKGAGRLTTRDAMIEVFGTASTIETHHFGGKTDWYTLTLLLAEHGHTQDSIGDKMPDFVAAMGKYMLNYIKEYPSYALPGALEAIDRLRQSPDVILGLVTGNAPTSARIKLEGAGFDWNWFKVGAFGSESVDRNDLPRFAFERVSKHSRVHISPRNCVIIGDTVMDVEAARANDMRIIGVRSGFEDQQALIAAKPDHLIDDLTQLFEVL